MRIQRSFAQFAIALSLTAASVPAQVAGPDHPVLGSGNGVDHTTLLTHSLVRTSRAFTDLGFTVSPLASYDNGFENSTIWFADGTYLELFGVHDSQAVAKGPEPHAADGPEGLTWVTIDTSSIEYTVGQLKARGHALFGPETLPSPDAWSYKLAGLEGDTLPGQRLYFIEYNRERINARRKAKQEAWRVKETHRNTAKGLAAVWVAVGNLAEAEKLYRDSGFTLGARISLPHLKAVGREIPTKDRDILLIEPAAGSPVAAMLKSRAATFVGQSVRVRSLATARSILAENELSLLAEYSGPYGRSVLIPPAKAGGAWLELFE